MNLPALRSPSPTEKLLVVGPEALARDFARLAKGLTTFVVAADLAEARVRLLGRPPEATVLLAEGGGPETLAAVQILASTGQAPLLLVAPGLPSGDEVVALRLGAAECLTVPRLDPAGLAAALARLRARGEHHARLRGNASLFEALVERDADGLLALDGGLLITYASAGVELLLGYPKEELPGRSALEFIPPEGTDEALHYIEAAMQQPGEHILGQALVLHADGSLRRIEGSIVNLLGDPPVDALIIAFRDATDRQRQERDLAERERHFRELAEEAPVMIWIEDADRRLVWENRTTLEFVGRAWEEEEGYGWMEVVHPDDRERVRQEYQETTAAQRGFTLDLRMRRHDGVYRHIRQIAIPRWDGEGRLSGFIGVDIDITELRDRSAMIEEAEARYRQLAETVPVSVWMDDAQHHLTYQNRTAEEFSGRKLSEQDGTAWFEDIHPDDRERVLASYRETSARPVPYQHMYRLRRFDGQYRWFIEIGVPRYAGDGEFIGFTGVDVDVDDLKQASVRLEQAEARYRHFIEQSNEGIWRLEIEPPTPVDLPEDEQIRLWYEHCYFAECNLAMARMYGFDRPEELLGARLRDLLPSDDATNLEMLKGFVRSGYRLVNAESHELDRHGRRKYFLNSLVGVVENGRLVRSWGTQQDITERRILEEEARQSRKMEAAGRLAGGIAHDFNNLLTAILGTSEMLMAQLPPHGTAREDVDEIKRAATRAANLTRQLLAFSRRQVLQPRTLDVDNLVRGVESLLRRLIGEHITLSVRTAPGLWLVRADPGQLEQVVVNLSVNARDAMPTGGDLVIETANCTFAGSTHGAESVMPPGEYVLLTLSDTGTGMDEETLRHLFEPFFTTKAQGKGTGLGLATVYGIVKQSGGFIFADSELSHGSRFRIYLPRIEGIVETSDTPPPAGATARAEGTILLVEDEEAVRRLARRVLENVGYQVLEAASGPEALMLADRWRGKLDLVVTDVIMPGMSGQELSARLRQQRPGLKILYVSGYTDDAILQHGRLLPNTAFLQKPFSPGSLAQRIREVLGR
jgi:two-component system, cell cycle sensor histidine kinase and response regulator CckA